MSIQDIPTADLVAELARRREVEHAASAPPEVLFYGVWPGTRAGHFLRNRNGSTHDKERGWLKLMEKNRGGASFYPWNYSDHHRRGRHGPEIQGLFHYFISPQRSFTLVTCWDRTEDNRGGCCSAFVAMGARTREEALGLAQTTYPAVFARMKAAGITVGWA